MDNGHSESQIICARSIFPSDEAKISVWERERALKSGYEEAHRKSMNITVWKREVDAWAMYHSMKQEDNHSTDAHKRHTHTHESETGKREKKHDGARKSKYYCFSLIERYADNIARVQWLIFANLYCSFFLLGRLGWLSACVCVLELMLCSMLLLVLCE